MNPNRGLFARITINGKRTDLGHATIHQLFLRAAQVYAGARVSGSELLIVLEASGAKLPDSSILNKEAIVEQQLLGHTVTDPEEESPFPGITIGRVQEVMASPEYIAWSYFCDPANREGVDHGLMVQVRHAYEHTFPDCVGHFPLYVES